MIRRLHHAQVTVPTDRLEDARRFYEEVLGLKQIERPTNEGWVSNGYWFLISDDGVALHIGVEDGVEGRPTTTTRAHIAYEVDDLAEMLQRVRAAGCQCKTDEPPGLPLIPGWRRFQSRDPFGNQIEFISPAGLG